MAILEVCGLKPFVAMSTLKTGMHGGGFYFSLFKKFPPSPPELLAHDEKYINARKAW